MNFYWNPKYDDKTSYFELNFFFSNASKFFLDFTNMFVVYGRYVKTWFCVSKKFVTARNSNQVICQEKWKKLRFCKNEAQNGVGIFWQNSILSAEIFFQGPLKKFWRFKSECCMYHKCAPNVALYARKKIRNIRHTNHEILAEMWKKVEKKYYLGSTYWKFFPLVEWKFCHLEKLNFLTSDVSKKFSVRAKYTFLVFKTFSYIQRIKRTLIESHMTSQSIYIEIKLGGR